jgi:superfamily I DNA/RNA helicase
MRCTKVIVDAVNDVLSQAKKEARLAGRIEKPYKHFPPAKGADSDKYPTIAQVRTSVQRANANYMGQSVAQIASQIPYEEVETANNGDYPVLLVIVAKPYRTQIVEYLDDQGFEVDTKRDAEGGLKREDGLALLKTDARSNAGWRIVLDSESGELTRATISSSKAMDQALIDLVPPGVRERILAEVEALEIAPTEEAPATPAAAGEPKVTIRVTSFEGAKGLSAQHVVIAGLHDGELPRDPKHVQDIEICRFLVGLTRTRKCCYLIHTGRFAQEIKRPSLFLTWIDEKRYRRITVNAEYWKRGRA